MTSQQQSDKEDFVRASNDIEDDVELKKMSYAELASKLSSCKAGSSKFMVIEREMKRLLAKDQAEINLPNMLWAAGFGGIFALAGVVIGWYLNMPPAREQIAQASAVQQMKNSNLTEKPPSGQVVISAGSGSNSINKPAPKQGNETPSN